MNKKYCFLHRKAEENMKCKVKANYLEVNGQLGKSLLVLLFLLSKLVAIPRKKLQSAWRRDDKQICTHQKNQFKLDIACENSRFSSRAWRNGCSRRLLSRGITSTTQRQKFLTDDVKLFTNDRHSRRHSSTRNVPSGEER